MIPRLNIGIFPINFIIVTASILIAATILHFISDKVIALLEGKDKDR